MNNCFGCNTCKSADKPLEAFIASLPLETSHHRVESQRTKCGFGLQGVCCRLCSNGPCRITPDAPRGICGANADTIVTRNFLRAVAAGSGCYIHVVENTALNLKNTARAKGPIKGEKALERLCQLFDISGSSLYEKAEKAADAVISDLYKPEYVQMELVEKLAYKPRFEKWKELGILPGGAKSEVFRGVVKCSTNLNSDPVDMLVDCLRLGISTGLYGLVLTNLLNDVLLGEPELRFAPVGLRVINPDYINIMITGHQHSMFTDLQERLIQPEAVAKAKAVGAKGFKLVGCTCVGQDLQLRGSHYTEIFDGHAGNNYTSEAILATGAIDAVLSEFNCTLPGIEPICEELKIKQICLDSVAKKANAELMEFPFTERAHQGELIIDKIVEAYAARRGALNLDFSQANAEWKPLIDALMGAYKSIHKDVPLNLLPDHGNDNTLTGVSEVSLKAFLGGKWKPLIDLIAAGEIKGLAGVVGCSNLTAGGHDVLSVELTKELIAKDILVLTAGCSSGGIENCGLMTPEAAQMAGPKLRAVCEKLGIPPVLNFGPCLAIGRLEIVASEMAEELGVDLPQLPLVLSAAQWLEEQALADGAYGLALGLPLHLGLPPFITGSKVAVKVLTEDMKQLTGGQLIINSDAKESAELLEKIILEKRSALNI
ncbi:carbon monoxide dehydrogenase [Aminipila butyrica]|uniref:Carbon monoxide dehydrogenase n=1 Tax=Aminipila butyrica TaxID=433296 RepID=A0A858BWR4_9FIRM|nr:carbon monoxide dehydrogenase [Aminipila butyrica]QIB69548.1 carbon monoxide dehydrogenase [Aminipila butyrica]